MEFYNQYKIRVSKDSQEMKWVTEIKCELEPKDGFVIVFDEVSQKWVYQSVQENDWIKYLYDLNLYKISNRQKFNEYNEIVYKSNDELLQEGIITKGELAQIQKEEIDIRLQEIDFESIRPLRAKLTGNNTKADDDNLSKLESEAHTLRDKRKNIS